MSGIKHDQNKVRVDLVPVSAIMAAARAFGYGVTDKKPKPYAPWNWLRGFAWMRIYGALVRHLLDFVMGVEKDAESGLHPLDHVLANAMILQVHVEKRLGKDDRPLGDGLPPEAFSSYEDPTRFRIVLRNGEESSYFEDLRFQTKAEAFRRLELSAPSLITTDIYKIEEVDE